MEEKLKVVLKQPENATIIYNGQIISVKPYISAEDQDMISLGYVAEAKSSLLNAEIFLLTAILSRCTNIEVSHIEIEDGKEVEKPSLLLDDIFANWQLMEDIRAKIVNFAEFHANLQLIVKLVTDKENSLSNAIQIGYTKLQDLIDMLTNSDISDEKIANVRDLLKDVESSSILNEATKIFRQGKTAQSTKKSPSPRKARKK